jgi:hypothetical protein
MCDLPSFQLPLYPEYWMPLPPHQAKTGLGGDPGGYGSAVPSLITSIQRLSIAKTAARVR